MVISRNWRLARLGNDSCVHSYGGYRIAAVNKIKSNSSNDMYSNYLDYHTSILWYQYGRYFGQCWTPNDVESVLFLAWKPAISNIAWGNPDDLTKRRHLLAHFGLKYLSNDGVNRDRFYCKNFPKIYTFRPAKESRTNFEWSVLLSVAKLYKTTWKEDFVQDMQRNGSMIRSKVFSLNVIFLS